MIIVLKGADFSANNIGQIEMAIPFADRTKEMLGYYGITVDESNSFQSAFNAFVMSLQSAGIFEKLKAICLPFMASVSKGGALSYAQINALDGSNFFVSDISGSLKLENKGLTPVANGNVTQVLIKGLVEATNIHIGCYNITTESDELYNEAPAAKYMFGRGGVFYGIAKNFPGSGSYAPALFTADRTLYGDTNYRNSSAFICINGTSEKVNIFTNGQKTEESATLSGYLSNPNFLVYDSATYNATPSQNNTYCKAAYSVVTVGHALSDSQVSVLTDAINKFMGVVKNM